MMHSGSPRDLVRRGAARHGSRRAVISLEGSLTYEEIAARTEALAQSLQSVGICPGVQVALALLNSPAFLVWYFGVLEAGGIVVPLGPAATPAKAEGLLSNSWIRVIALSLLFALIFIVMTWWVQRNLTDSLGNLYDQLSLTLDTTSQGLSVMSSTLTSTSESLFQLQNTMLSMAQSVHDASLLAESVSVLVGEDLPTMILSAQTSLASAQASANVIDDVLITLSKIPFIGVDYDPDGPLSTSLINIAYSLSLLTDSLETIQTKSGYHG